MEKYRTVRIPELMDGRPCTIDFEDLRKQYFEVLEPRWEIKEDISYMSYILSQKILDLQPIKTAYMMMGERQEENLNYVSEIIESCKDALDQYRMISNEIFNLEYRGVVV